MAESPIVPLCTDKDITPLSIKQISKLITKNNRDSFLFFSFASDSDRLTKERIRGRTNASTSIFL